MAELRALEARLSELAADLDWPPTPDLARAVRARLEPRRRPRQWRWVLAAAAALVLALVAVLGVSPGARETVAGWIGIRGVKIERVQKVPTPSPLPSGGVGASLSLGLRTSLDQIEEPKLALVPTRLGQPDEVYQRAPGAGPVVSLVYRPRPDLPADPNTGVGALVVEMRGSLTEYTFVKGLGPGTRIRQVQVRGTTGYWISGAPHAFISLAGGGAGDELRLAGDVLIWTENGMTYRIESKLTLDQALAVAQSMR